MAKDTFYFSHDYSARNDPNMIKLFIKENMAGIGIYWCLIEMLYEQNGYLDLSELETYAFALRTQCEQLNRVIRDYGLFEIGTDKFYSKSVLRRLEQRENRSEKARESAFKRWNNADAMPTQCEGNAKKERKGNKRKGNKGKEIKLTGFELIFKDWFDYKQSRKESYKSEKSIIAFKDKLRKLSNNNESTAREIIEQSMANNWAGIFELKTKPVKAGQSNQDEENVGIRV